MSRPTPDSIVGTRTVTDARANPASFEGRLPDGPYDVLGVAGDSVIGGGSVVHDPSAPGAPVVIGGCWAVEDLDAPHWFALAAPKGPGLRVFAVPSGTAAAVRGTIDRLARHHARALERAACRADGARETVGHVVRAAIDVGADVGRAMGDRAR